jgi:hypothetical protein
MAKTNSEVARITYGRLDKALADLGFVRRNTEAFTVYREADHDALIVLPKMQPDSRVGDPHLVTVRNTVTLKGVASADRFQTLLVKPRVSHNSNGFQVYKRRVRRPAPRQIGKA